MDQPDFADLNSRIDAYRGLDADALPTLWTPERVQERLVEAFGVLRRSAGRVGPRGPGSAWPSVLQNMEEWIDAEAIVQAQLDGRDWMARRMVDRAVTEIAKERDRRAGEAVSHDARPTADETSRADEALGWALEILRLKPLHADALQLFALCHAYDLDIAKVLRRRTVRVDRMVAVSQAALVAAGDAAPVRRQDVAPGKVYSRTRLDAWRKEGAAIIAAALNRRRIIVR